MIWGSSFERLVDDTAQACRLPKALLQTIVVEQSVLFQVFSFSIVDSKSVCIFVGVSASPWTGMFSFWCVCVCVSIGVLPFLWNLLWPAGDMGGGGSVAGYTHRPSKCWVSRTSQKQLSEALCPHFAKPRDICACFSFLRCVLSGVSWLIHLSWCTSSTCHLY